MGRLHVAGAEILPPGAGPGLCLPSASVVMPPPTAHAVPNLVPFSSRHALVLAVLSFLIIPSTHDEKFRYVFIGVFVVLPMNITLVSFGNSIWTQPIDLG